MQMSQLELLFLAEERFDFIRVDRYHGIRYLFCDHELELFKLIFFTEGIEGQEQSSQECGTGEIVGVCFLKIIS